MLRLNLVLPLLDDRLCDVNIQGSRVPEDGGGWRGNTQNQTHAIRGGTGTGHEDLREVSQSGFIGHHGGRSSVSLPVGGFGQVDLLKLQQITGLKQLDMSQSITCRWHLVPEQRGDTHGIVYFSFYWYTSN